MLVIDNKYLGKFALSNDGNAPSKQIVHIQTIG
jgi:hypothetical protein